MNQHERLGAWSADGRPLPPCDDSGSPCDWDMPPEFLPALHELSGRHRVSPGAAWLALCALALNRHGVVSWQVLQGAEKRLLMSAVGAADSFEALLHLDTSVSPAGLVLAADAPSVLICQLDGERPVDPADAPCMSLVVWNGRARLVMQGWPSWWPTGACHCLPERLMALLQGVLAGPERPLPELPLVGPRESDTLLHAWNDTAVDWGPALCLHEHFEAQVARTPDQVALMFEGETLSYRQLNERANQLARHLRQLGVGRETLVGICLERSFELVVALYAVIKAGGAYVPLDPSHPVDRLAYMLEDTQAPVVLTQASLVSCLPPIGGTLFLLDQQWPEVTQWSVDNLPALARPSDLVYCLYTSGSTGKPKGVPNVHEGVVNTLLWMQQTYPLGASDRMLQKTAIGFDVSVWGLFWPLMAGASLVIARPEGHRDPVYLRQLAESSAVTVLDFVPSMLQLFLDVLPSGACPTLKWVLCIGEALPRSTRDWFFELLPHVALHNLYGPTEAAIHATWWDCAQAGPGASVPIGRPIANMQLHVLDAHLQPTPIGVPGEVHIGGIGLARGYLNRPELTAEKFIANPFGPAGSRLYKTGDLGRYLPDGNLDYLGRLDLQVKIRGLRIELGEIEATLLDITGVREAAVLALPDHLGDARLVAYVCPSEGGAPTVESLREQLLQALPAYMLPSAWVFLEALPHNASGKIDRNALAQVKPDDSSRHAQGPLDTEWQSGLEEELAGLWRTLLASDAVHRDANFLLVGGSSLLAMRLSAQIARHMGRQFSALQILLHPVLQDQAHHLAMAPMVAQADDVALPDQAHALTQGQQDLLLAHQLDPLACAYLVHMALIVPAALGMDALRVAAQTLWARHLPLRLQMRQVDGQWHAWEADAQTGLAWTPWPALVQAPSDMHGWDDLQGVVQRPMDLAQGVSRCDVWPLPGGAHVWVWSFHHAVIDDASIDQVLAELNLVLSGQPLPALHGRPAMLPLIERQWLSSPQAQVADLLTHRAEVTPILPRAPSPGMEQPMPWQGADPYPALKAAGEALGCSPFALCLLAHGLALQQVFGREQGLVATPFSRRTDASVSDVPSYWLDVRLIDAGARADETRAQTWRRLMREVALAQGQTFLPVAHLAQALVEQGQPALAASLMQFGFTWRLQPSRKVSVGGHGLSLLRVPQRSSRYGLALHVAQIGSGIQCCIEAVQSAFDDGSVARLWQAFQHQLDELLGAVAELQAAPDMPDWPVVAQGGSRPHEAALKQAWARWALVPQESIKPHSHWMKQGGTSMAAIRMAAQLQREAGITLNLSAFFLAPTFAGLCASVQAPASESLARWVFVGPSDAEHLHVLIPGAGGHAEGLVRLAHALLESLGSGHSLAILDLDGLCERAPTQGTLVWLQEALAQQLSLLPASRIRSLQGFSLGGLLALAMSNQNWGRDLMPVVLIDTWAPRAFRDGGVRAIERLVCKAWAWLMATPGTAPEQEPPAEALLTQAASTRLERTPRVIWDLLSAEMANQPYAAPKAQVFFVTARHTADQLHLIWRRASRGFKPSLYASWQQAELPCDHLDLPRHMAPQTASLMVGWLRSVGATGQSSPASDSRR